jgi:hypothetical protein
MRPSESLRAELLAVWEALYAEVLRRDYGTSMPYRGKLIREGLRMGRRVLEETAIIGEPAAYLATLLQNLEAEKEICRRNPYSEDGWNDEDGDILGGLSSVQREVERLAHEL